MRDDQKEAVWIRIFRFGCPFHNPIVIKGAKFVDITVLPAEKW